MIWKTAIIDGVEKPRYKVSSDGQILCLNWNKTGKERLCRLSVNSDGYLMVAIDGVKKYVHRIVAETFLPCPNTERNCIDHINTVKTDNFVILAADGQTVLDSNLRWVSHKENSRNPLSLKHMSENAHCLGKFGDDCPYSIPIIQLTKDGVFIKKWPAAMDVERELGIHQSNITSCCKGKRKSAGGFRWKYAC